MKCKRCKVDKELPEKGRCAGCNEYIKNYYKENKTQEIERAKRNNDKKSRAEINQYKKELNRKNPLSIMLQQAKRRAKLKNLPFDITANDLMIPDICPVLGIPLCVNSTYAKNDSISLDRIVPELGYVKGNVEIISYKANTIKNNASVEDLERVLSWLKNKLEDV